MEKHHTLWQPLIKRKGQKKMKKKKKDNVQGDSLEWPWKQGDRAEGTELTAKLLS